MIVVIDTNVLLTTFKPTHRNHNIFRAWTTGRFAWAVATDILLEYEEIMTRLGSAAYAAQALRTVSMIGTLRSGSLIHVSPSFFFRTISADRDDDKFADCAIAANADFIITGDKHFNVLIGSGFKPQPITPENFIARHLAGYPASYRVPPRS